MEEIHNLYLTTCSGKIVELIGRDLTEKEANFMKTSYLKRNGFMKPPYTRLWKTTEGIWEDFGSWIYYFLWGEILDETYIQWSANLPKEYDTDEQGFRQKNIQENR